MLFFYKLQKFLFQNYFHSIFSLQKKRIQIFKLFLLKLISSKQKLGQIFNEKNFPLKSLFSYKAITDVVVDVVAVVDAIVVVVVLLINELFKVSFSLALSLGRSLQLIEKQQLLKSYFLELFEVTPHLTAFRVKSGLNLDESKCFTRYSCRS